MAEVTVTTLPDLVSIDSGEDTEVIINHPIFEAVEYPTVLITVVSGIIKFAVGNPATDSDATYESTDDPFPITLRNAVRKSALNLHAYVDATGGATFKVSFVIG